MDGNGTPNLNVIKGLIFTAFGCMFIIFAYSIIIRMIFFVSGILLVYYGLQILNLPALNQITSTIKSALNKLFS